MAKKDYVPYSGALVTRAEAVKAGETKYFLNKPCKKAGHISQWFVHGGCVECQRVARRKNDERYSSSRDDLLNQIAGRPKPNKCEACGQKGKRIVFDHCATSLKFRGWLCDGCNLGIGILKESPQRLRALARYLEKNSPGLVIEDPQFRVTRSGMVLPEGYSRG